MDLVIKGDGHQGTPDEFATIPFHLVLFSAALVELTNSIPVHSLILQKLDIMDWNIALLMSASCFSFHWLL